VTERFLKVGVADGGAAGGGEDGRIERQNGNFFKVPRIEALLVLREDLHLLLGRRIVDANLEKEPVELGLRKRIRAFKFDGVLRGEDGEVFRQRIADAVNGHLALLHGLEKGGLRARRSAVDFVHQQ